MQTKNAAQFWQHYNALFDLLLPQQCPLCRPFFLIMAFAPIAGRSWFLSPRLFVRFLQAPFIALAESNHLIVPTPLHAKRYLRRRFNQSAKLVSLLCHQNKTSIFAPDALVRPKAGPTQAGLSCSQRQRNLAGAFAVPQDQRQRTANPPVLLIDDVMTTGANCYEAAKTLHRAGSGPVRGLVLARVLRHGL